MTEIRDRNACAYKEIYEILKIFPNELVSKIPKEKIDFFYNNMDKNYKYDISVETFDGQTMLEETTAILTILFRDYWATPQQREKILNYEETFKRKMQEKANMQYNSEELFKNKEIKMPVNEHVQETALVEYKENIFQRIKNIILKLFNKSNK